MKIIKVYVNMTFVDGTLNGVDLVDNFYTYYPLSERENIERSFNRLVSTRKELGVKGSKYVVTGYRLEESSVDFKSNQLTFN